MLLARLFDNLALQVVAFATCLVARGWRLRLPPLDWITLHFVVQGTGRLRDANGNPHVLPQDSLGVVPPHLVHAIECGQRVLSEAAPKSGPPDAHGLPAHVAGPVPEAELIVVCGSVRVTYGPNLGLFDQLRDVLILDFSDQPDMRANFQALLKEQKTGGPGAPFMMTALMNQCLVHIFRRLCENPDCTLPWLLALDDPRMARVVDAILAHPEKPHTVESLAELAHLSRSAFAKRFHDNFGRTPMDYVRDVRLRRAAQLLRRDHRLSVDAVASRVGFASRSRFSHAFHELFGTSPKDFRAEVV